MFGIYVVVGLRAMFGIYVVVGLRALFGIYVVVGLRVMFFAGFGNLPVQGRCCRNFESTLTIFALFCRRTCGCKLGESGT
jgi:hypothetical protein